VLTIPWAYRRQVRAAVRGLLLAGVMGALPPPAHASLINPGFETGDLTGWSTSGTVAVASCASAPPGCAPGGGAWLADINLPGVGSSGLLQAMPVIGPGTYAFGAWVSYGTNQPLGNFAQGQVSLTVQGTGVAATLGGDPNAIAGQFTVPGGAFTYTPWTLLAGTLTYTGTGPVDLIVNVNVQNASEPNGLRLLADNLYLTAISVPEPAALLLTGLAALAAGLRRRHARHRP